MVRVTTAKGLLSAQLLAVTDVISYSENARELATEWRLRTDLIVDGAVVGEANELVRRDVWINVMEFDQKMAAVLGAVA
ncbi:MAG: hypothetical protein ACRD3Q_00355 [Terriglobales bacterium]